MKESDAGLGFDTIDESVYVDTVVTKVELVTQPTEQIRRSLPLLGNRDHLFHRHTASSVISNSNPVSDA